MMVSLLWMMRGSTEWEAAIGWKELEPLGLVAVEVTFCRSFSPPPPPLIELPPSRSYFASPSSSSTSSPSLLSLSSFVDLNSFVEGINP